MLAPDPRFGVIDSMDGFAFEEAVAELLELLGAEDVKRMPRFDRGADIVAVRDGVRTAVQVKRWTNAVDVAAVRQLVDGMRHYDCPAGLLVTNSFLTERALDSARAWDIEVWDRAALAEYLDGEAPAIDPNLCAECGMRVSPGVRDWCLAHPGRYGGSVFCRVHQRRRRPVGESWQTG
jgi:hypothetical protein